jgi:predicted MPP superfamily phosphohydrolase
MGRWAKAAGSLGVIAGSGLALAGYARYVEPRWIKLERIALGLPIGADALAGMKIGFVTDLHSGPFTSLKTIARGLAMIEAERPDLVLLGGDFHSESPRYVAGVAELLGSFASQIPLGCVGVMGNHDYAVSGGQMVDALAAVGVRTLCNDAAEVQYHGAALWIAGIDDTLLGEPDALSAFAQVPDGAPVLSLWHEPLHAEQAAALGAFAQLSGHTHGGQIRLPLIGALAVPKHGHRYIAGFSSIDEMPVYTSRGLGMYRPPLRLNCRPEVTLITLNAAGN